MLSWTDMWIKIQIASESWKPLKMAVWCSKRPGELKESVYPPKELWQVGLSDEDLCLHDISKDFLGETVIRPLGTTYGQHQAWDPWTQAVLLRVGSQSKGVMEIVCVCCSQGWFEVTLLCSTTRKKTGLWFIFHFYFYKNLQTTKCRTVNSPDFEIIKIFIFTSFIHFSSSSILKQIPYTVSFLPAYFIMHLFLERGYFFMLLPHITKWTIIPGYHQQSIFKFP